MHSVESQLKVFAIIVFCALVGDSLYLFLSHCAGILRCQVLDVGLAAFLLAPDDLPLSYPHLLAQFSILIPGKVYKEQYM